MSDPQTRRNMLQGAAMVVVAATLPVAVMATTAAPSDPKAAKWAMIERQAATFDPNGSAIVRRARQAGLDPDEYSGMGMVGEAPNELSIVFGDGWIMRDGGPYTTVTMGGVEHWMGPHWNGYRIDRG